MDYSHIPRNFHTLLELQYSSSEFISTFIETIAVGQFPYVLALL